MAENLPALLVAKVKAVGLIAGTALVTTALVGGGAVAVTVVSNDKAQGPPAADELVLDADAAARGAEQRSDTATAAIQDKGKPDDGDDDGERKGCGEQVSAVASAKEAGTPGRDHGATVSATARACNGSLGEDDAPGRSADKPADPGRSGTAGRPQSGPGSPDVVGSKGGSQGKGSQGKAGSQGKSPDRD